MATVVGGPFAPPLTGTVFGFDFNPVVDRMRVVSDAEQNLRLNPNTGGVAGVDTNLAYAPGDLHAGANPTVTASAYTNNIVGAGVTTLYGIDVGLDVLIRQNPPNGGTLNTVGPLGVDAADSNGL